MSTRALVAGVVLVSAVSTALAARPAAARGDERSELQAIREERRDLELKLETMRRRLPAGFEEDSALEMVRGLAKRAELAVEVTASAGSEVVPLEDGRPSDLLALRLDVSGRENLLHLHSFFDLLTVLDIRLRDLDSLELEGDGGEELAVRARLVFVGAAPRQLPAEATRSPLVERERAELADLRARVRQLEAWDERTDDGRLATAAALLGALSEARSARFTGVRVGAGVAVEGVTVGAAARAGLLAALGKGGFAVRRIESPAAGACRPFALALARGAASGPPETVAGAPARAAALCAAPAGGPVQRLVARGGAGGALSLRMRDVGLADLFLVLHDLTGEGFVVDADVAGRADVEIEDASPEEALSALRSAGLAIGERPLRRVSRGPAAAPAEEFTGDPVSVSLTAAGLDDVLCLFADITSLGFRVPPDLGARTTIYAREVAWDRVLETILASAGLGYAIDGTTVYVGPPAAVTASGRAAWPDACAAGRASREIAVADLRPPLAELGASDLELAGVAIDGTAVRAYAYGGGRRLLALAPGDRLFDASVKSVAADGVTLSLDGGGEARLPAIR